MRARSRASFAAFALAPIFALGAALPAAASIGCLRGNLLRSECCRHTESHPDTRLERRCCCEVDAPAAPSTPRAEAAAASARGPETSGAALAPDAHAGRRTPSPVRVAVASATRATGPPLILLKRSLLI